MAAKKRVVVAGARGVFGSLLVQELAAAYDVIATTRETLDLRDVDAVGRAAREAFAFVCAAGPFQQLDRRIVRAVVESGAHWLDIADDERWFFDLIDDAQLDAFARERGVVVMSGLSTLPAISCALVKMMERRRPAPADAAASRAAAFDRVTAPDAVTSAGAGRRRAERLTITLFIGNDNAKGAAAISSGAALQTPDRELLRREGIEAVVRTRFEMPGVPLAMRVLATLPIQMRTRVAKVLSRIARLARFGTRGGYVEVRAGDAVERVNGADQRLAILPVVFALSHLPPPGVHAPTVLDAGRLLKFVRERAS